MNKGFNIVTGYKDNIRRIRDHGIAVFGAFMFGFDHDGPDVFEKTVRFAQDSRLEGAQFNNLTPFPGTPLFDQMKSAGRILTENWSQYHADQVVFQPRLMSVTELKEGRDWAEREFFSIFSILRRIGLTHSNPWVWLALNLNYRRDPVSQWLFNEVMLPMATKHFEH